MHIDNPDSVYRALRRLRENFLMVCGTDGLEGQFRDLAQNIDVLESPATALDGIDAEVRLLESVIQAILSELPANCTPAASPAHFIADRVFSWAYAAVAVLGRELGTRYRGLVEATTKLQEATILAPQWP